MPQTLQRLYELIWVCLLIGVVYALLSFIALKRRPLWIRFLDAEAAFWKRVGLPRLSFDRTFGESRFFTYSLVFFTLAFLLLAAGATVLYLHISHQAR